MNFSLREILGSNLIKKRYGINSSIYQIKFCVIEKKNDKFIKSVLKDLDSLLLSYKIVAVQACSWLDSASKFLKPTMMRNSLTRLHYLTPSRNKGRRMEKLTEILILA